MQLAYASRDETGGQAQPPFDQRTVLPLVVQQRPLFRGAAATQRPLPLGRKDPERALGPLPRPQRAHDGRDEDDGQLPQGVAADRRL